MNANDQFFARDAKVDSAAVAPLPASRKIYVQGTRADIRVPMREIAQTDTPASMGAEANPPLAVYDTSGPYTDPGGAHRHPSWLAGAARTVDRCARRHGDARGTDVGVRSRSPCRCDALRPALQSASPAAPREERRERHADALRAPRHRHAGDGVHRDPRESAPRGNARAHAGKRAPPACRPELRRQHSGDDDARSSSATRWRAAARSSRTTSTIRKPSR